MNCRTCSWPMVPGTASVAPPGHVIHKSRRLCRRCFSAAERRGMIAALPRVYRRGIDVINGTADLAEMGMTRHEIAAHFGLKPDSLYQVHRRAGVPCPV